MAEANVDFFALTCGAFGAGLGLLGVRRSSITSLTLIGAMIALLGAGWLAFRSNSSSAPLTIQAPLTWKWSVSTTVAIAQTLALTVHLATVMLLSLAARIRSGATESSRWWILPVVATNVCMVIGDPLSVAGAFLAAHVLLAVSPSERPSIWFCLARTVGGMLVVASVLLGANTIQFPVGLALPWHRVAVVAFAAGVSLSMLGLTRRARNADPTCRIYRVIGPLVLLAALLINVGSLPVGRTNASMIAISTGIAIAAIVNLLAMLQRHDERPNSGRVDSTTPEIVARVESFVETSVAAPLRLIERLFAAVDSRRAVAAPAVLLLTAVACLAAIAVSIRSSGAVR